PLVESLSTLTDTTLEINSFSRRWVTASGRQQPLHPSQPKLPLLGESGL
ncbi:MAG: hypothetical protein ACI8SI_003026, partial [Congregibacter sp.]